MYIDLRYYFIEGDDSSGENEDENCNPKSRLKVDVRAVLNEFTKYKKFMLWEIKYDGLLKLPAIKKVHLKFSTFPVSSTDVKEPVH